MNGSRKTADDESLSRDALFSILRNERRRNVLQYLRDEDDAVKLRTLSEQIAAWETDQSIGAVTYDQRKRVQTALYQMHLPKLAEWGVVEYDKRGGTVELTPLADECFQVLDGRAGADEGAWWKRYLGVAGVSIVGIGLKALDVPPLGAVPDAAYAVVIPVAFALLSVAYAAQNRATA